MRFTATVALRILSGVRHRYLSVVSRIAVAGVALGVAALVVVFSISDGFSRAFQENILSLYPHMVVLRRGSEFARYHEVAGDLERIDGVVEAVPSTYDELMAVHQDRRGEVVLKGLPLERAGVRARLARVLRVDSLPDVAPPTVATATDSAVRLSGGVAGEAAQVLVLDGAGGPSVHVSRPLWARPTAGFDLVRFGGPEGLEVRCGEGAGERVERVPAGGGFSPFMRLNEGRSTCRVRVDDPGLDGRTPKALQWSLDADGGVVRTILLAAGGAPREGMDFVEPGDPSEVASRVRVYRPDADAHRVVIEGGGGAPEVEVAVAGAASRWILREGLQLPGVLLGGAVARRLRAEVGDEVRLMTPLRGIDGTSVGPLGMAPSVTGFRVAGVLRTGFHEFDSRFAVADLHVVQRFFNRGDVVRWIEVRIDDVEQTDERARAVRRALDSYGLPDLLGRLADARARMDRLAAGDVGQFPSGDARGAVDVLQRAALMGRMLRSSALDLAPDPRFKVIDWRRMNQNLLSAIRLQRVVLTIFFLIIILVAASNVVGNQIMLIHEKTPTIAILRAMGASRRQIQRIFRLQGQITAGLGAVIGALVGVGLCTLLRDYPIQLNAEIYFIDELPVEPSAGPVVVVIAATMLGTWFATRFTARRAASLEPVEALHRVD